MIKRTVGEIVLGEALERWWESELALGCDRLNLLQNLGCARASQYSRWHWRSLPQDIKELLVNYSLSGKPVEFLATWR